MGRVSVINREHARRLLIEGEHVLHAFQVACWRCLDGRLTGMSIRYPAILKMESSTILQDSWLKGMSSVLKIRIGHRQRKMGSLKNR
jgi:hypothetical protein